MNSLMLEPKHLASRPSFSAVSVVFRPTHKHEKSSLCSQFQFRIAFSDVKIKIVEVFISGFFFKPTILNIGDMISRFFSIFA